MTGNETAQAKAKRRRSIYVLPSFFTAMNVFCGFYAAIAALKGYQALSTDTAEAARLFDNAARAIGFAVLFDGLDGAIARMTKTSSDFGIELDSLADVISFGIAPALLAYAWGYGSMVETYSPEFAKVGWAVSFAYLVCGAFRLARFNVHAKRTIVSSTKDKKQFVGLPIPAAAGLIAAIVHFSPLPLVAREANHLNLLAWSLEFKNAMVNVGFLLLVAFLSMVMISTVRYRSFKEVGTGVLSPRWTFILLPLFVAGIYFYSRWVLLVMATSYALHGILIKVATWLRRGKHEAATVEMTAK